VLNRQQQTVSTVHRLVSMSLIDVETTAEAIQEDEELIEAVNTLAATAAVSISSEIYTCVQDTVETVKLWLVWLFPLWVWYQENPALFWEDLQKLAFCLTLMVISFILLAPSSGRRGRSAAFQRRRKLLGMRDRHSFKVASRRHSAIELIPGNQILSAQQQLQKPTSMFNMSCCTSASATTTTTANAPPRGGKQPYSSICSGRIIVEAEETDQERFEKVYRHICKSGYSRLVLPPECKLIEKHKRPSITKEKKAEKSKATTAGDSVTTGAPANSSMNLDLNATTTANEQHSNNKRGKYDKKQRKRRKKREKLDEDSYEDQPYNRLKSYFFDFLRLIWYYYVTFDFMAVGSSLIRCFKEILKVRQLNRSNSPLNNDDDTILAEEEEDDDDESRASTIVSLASSQILLQPANHALDAGAPLTPRGRNIHFSNVSTSSYEQLSQSSSQQSKPNTVSYMSANADSVALRDEEKRESLFATSINGRSSATQTLPPLSMLNDLATTTTYAPTVCIRQQNNNEAITSETFSTSAQHSMGTATVARETDDATMVSLKLPLTLPSKSQGKQTATLRPSVNGGKKKDLLENYRSSVSSVLQVSAPRNTTNAQSTTSTTNSSANSISSCTAPNMHSSSSADTAAMHRSHIDLEEKEEEEGYLVEESDALTSASRQQRMDSDFSQSYFFETANSHESIQRMSIEAPLPDKNGYIVGDEFLPHHSCTPVLVFVNSRSGPQQGHLLITQLRRLLNPIQVWDLGEDGGPEIVLESFLAFRNLRILVCGGDGTVSWIIATLEKMKLKRKWPPIAILPLGTGNDLARIHGWGGGYNNEPLDTILEDVADSYVSLLDRWELTIENRKGKVKDVKSFFNYLGVGADAQAALQVHMLRESKPQLFFSRIVNKAWYGIFGAEDIIKATSMNLPNEITLIADGVEVPLPLDSQGIIFLNIDSYAGGAPIWSTGTKRVSGGLHGFAPAHSDIPGGSRAYTPGGLRRSRSLE